MKIDVEGSGGANRTATIISGANLRGSGTVTVKGGTSKQHTSPDNAGNLRLRATVGGKVVGQSNGFTVAAFPFNHMIKFLDDIDVDEGPNGGVGLMVEERWKRATAGGSSTEGSTN